MLTCDFFFETELVRHRSRNRTRCTRNCNHRAYSTA